MEEKITEETVDLFYIQNQSEGFKSLNTDDIKGLLGNLQELN